MSDTYTAKAPAGIDERGKAGGLYTRVSTGKPLLKRHKDALREVYEILEDPAGLQPLLTAALAVASADMMYWANALAKRQEDAEKPGRLFYRAVRGMIHIDKYMQEYNAARDDAVSDISMVVLDSSDVTKGK